MTSFGYDGSELASASNNLSGRWNIEFVDTGAQERLFIDHSELRSIVHATDKTTNSVDQLWISSTAVNDAQTGLLEKGKVTGLGLSDNGVTYDNIDKLHVHTGSGNDQVRVASTNVDTYLATNAGNDHIIVSDESSTTTDGIAADITIDAGDSSGENNTLLIDDKNDLSADSIVMSNALAGKASYTSVTGIADGGIHFKGSFASQDPSDKGVVVQAGKGNDRITINGVIEHAHTFIKGGEGDDDIIVTSQNSGSNRELSIEGQLGEDVVDARHSKLRVTASGNEGDDVILGSAFNDVLHGNQGDDLIIAGLGADTIRGGQGKDILLGDLGGVGFENQSLTYTSLTDDDYSVFRLTEITQFESLPTTNNSNNNDDMDGGADGDIVLGGSGTDQISDLSGHSLIFGDHAKIIFASMGVVASARSTSTQGQRDNIHVSGTNNLVVAGIGDDKITSEGGSSIVLGDNGDINYDGQGELVSVTSELSTLGGNDRIELNLENSQGDNIVIAGVGDDTVLTGGGSDTIFGDNALLSYASGTLNRIETTDNSSTTSGADNINAGDGDNIIFGGLSADTLVTGTGNSLIMGDLGFVQYASVSAEFEVALSQLSSQGGNDTITTVAGNNIIFGSAGSDLVRAGSGDDVIFGDNGIVNFRDGIISQLQTTDTTTSTSGADEIYAGAGADLIFAGLGNDVVFGESGHDKIVGDLGVARFSGASNIANNLTEFESYSSNLGAQDRIDGGSGNDVLIGGAANDYLTGGEGSDFISGDGGLAKFAFGHLISAETSESFIGGDDILIGGAGQDILFGGFGSDTFYGGLNTDTMVGEYARAIVNTTDAGFDEGIFLVRLGQGNLDLIGDAQFSLYNFKRQGLGFSPISDFKPLGAVDFSSIQIGNLFSGDGNNGSRSGIGGVNGSNQPDIFDVINSLPATAAGVEKESEQGEEEKEECYDEEGFVIECVAEESLVPVSEQPQDMLEAEHDVEQETGEQKIDEQAQPLPDESIETSATQNLDDSSSLNNGESADQETRLNQESDIAEEDVGAALMLSLAGWKVASANSVKKSTDMHRDFDKLRYNQRHMQRWDAEKQCFVSSSTEPAKTDKKQKLEWELAAENIKSR